MAVLGPVVIVEVRPAGRGELIQRRGALSPPTGEGVSCCTSAISRSVTGRSRPRARTNKSVPGLTRRVVQTEPVDLVRVHPEHPWPTPPSLPLDECLIVDEPLELFGSCDLGARDDEGAGA